MRNYKKLLSLSIVSVVISGCGGGGGGGTSSPVVKNPPSYYETTEYNAQYGLSNINASEIYSDGYSGSGVTVAVIDTGVVLDHPDLVDNIASGGYDYYGGNKSTSGTADSDANPDGQGAFMSHGTHVAGIIAGMKNDVGMHGVAYNAKILALRAGNSAGSLDTISINNSIQHAIDQGVKVINASFGGPDSSSTLAAKWKLAHGNDIVTVHSAGNSSGEDPLLSTYDAYTDSSSTPIAVVATNSNDKIADYSNWCGTAKLWCMAAPGSSIYSTVDTTDTTDINGDGYDTYDGTSMAAPHVSGSIAVLRSKWPSKTAAQVVTILFDTATDLRFDDDPDKSGDGPDAKYGMGLLNLDNALYAQGALTVQTASGGSHYLNDSNLSTSSVLGNALSKSVKTAIYDKYKRDYYFNLNNAITMLGSDNTHEELTFNDSNVEIDLEPGVKLFSEIDNGSIQIQNDYRDMNISFSHKRNPAKVFAFNSQTDVAGLSNAYSLYGDSHLSQIKHAKVVNISSDGNVKTSLGVVSGYTDIDSTHAINGINASMLTNLTKNLSLTAQVSSLKEDETFLSSYFSGAYQTGVAKTNSVNLIAKSEINNHLNFITQYSKGTTKVNTLSDSVVSNISGISSEGYSMSLVGSDIYAKGDTLFTTFKQPMKVTNGNMTLTTANGLNLDDSISFTNQTVNLSPAGTERVLAVGYTKDYDKDTSIVTVLNHISNPNHDTSLKSENYFMIKMTKKF